MILEFFLIVLGLISLIYNFKLETRLELGWFYIYLGYEGIHIEIESEGYGYYGTVSFMYIDMEKYDLPEDVTDLKRAYVSKESVKIATGLDIVTDVFLGILLLFLSGAMLILGFYVIPICVGVVGIAMLCSAMNKQREKNIELEKLRKR